MPQFNAAHGSDGWASNYTSISRARWQTINGDGGASPYKGCDKHYNGRGHQALADAIEGDVRRFMGWQHDEDAVEVRSEEDARA